MFRFNLVCIFVKRFIMGIWSFDRLFWINVTHYSTTCHWNVQTLLPIKHHCRMFHWILIESLMVFLLAGAVGISRKSQPTDAGTRNPFPAEVSPRFLHSSSIFWKLTQLMWETSVCNSMKINRSFTPFFNSWWAFYGAKFAKFNLSSFSIPYSIKLIRLQKNHMILEFGATLKLKSCVKPNTVQWVCV